MDLQTRMKNVLLPGFRTGHTQYVDFVKAEFRDGCCWLDAGGGRRIFHDAYDGEDELVARAKLVVVADGDLSSLDDHATVTNRVCCSLSALPLADEAFDFVTCGMVVEHLSEPGSTFRELARVLKPGGKLIVHTVNLWGYPTLMAIGAKAIPESVRPRLIAQTTGRLEEDIFPAHYRCNTIESLCLFVEDAGLRVEKASHLPAGVLLKNLFPAFLLEMLYIRMSLLPRLERLRGQLLVSAVKPK